MQRGRWFTGVLGCAALVGLRSVLACVFGVGPETDGARWRTASLVDRAAQRILVPAPAPWLTGNGRPVS